MQRFWSFLTNSRTLSVIGIVALAAFLFVGASTLQLAVVWSGVLIGVFLFVWLAVWLFKRWRARQAAQGLEQVIEQQAERAAKTAPPGKRVEVEALRLRLRDAVKTIKTSKLGETSGAAALYEMPWYMVIGNPAAGKSSAIVKSGLQFPFSDHTGSVIQGIGGTRNCDWFFTTQGILLDTAGRYSVHEEDREEWFGFLELLKKYRPKAPINGILMAVSLGELGAGKPEVAIALAKQLRQRMQELTEKLEVFAPVYLVFTKADLVSGFVEFFQDRDTGERDRVWGSTLPYQADGHRDPVVQFEERFDELYEGLKEASVARMTLDRGQKLPPGVLTFPLEFATLKPALRSFVATLFEDNPYQYRPVFRGFYFTSALQQGESSNRSGERVAQRFGLRLEAGVSAMVMSQTGFFLKDLFAKVIFADRALVRQFASRTKLRLRYASFFAAVLALGLALGVWTWSAIGNQRLMANVEADLDKAVKLQQNRLDLQSRLEAMEILQDRIQQLQGFRDERPWSMSLGLYQGDKIERKLRDEYFAGVSEIMLKPTGAAIEDYLREVNGNALQLQPVNASAESIPTTAGNTAVGAEARAAAARTQAASAQAATPYSVASPTNVQDAYNALKTYIMLSDRTRLETGHLSDQITRFWRGWLEANRGTMSREQTIRSAERMISFTLSQANDPAFPQRQSNIATLDQTRESLRRVIKGMPARERVYGEIKARASTRFAPVTVARLIGDQDKEVIAGSYAISGAFTREAWENYVQEAIKTAAFKELQSDDWVLKTSARDDLTLEGSPEQIQKALVQMYKTEYTTEWQKFMKGISVLEFANFTQAVARMDRLGDPQTSPIGKLMDALFRETSWDNPSIINERLGQAKRGVLDWFKQVILRQAPSGVNLNVNLEGGKAGEIPMGPIGREFAGLTRLMMVRDNNPTPMRNYLEALSKLRTRFNQLKNQGDAGPGSRQLIQQTLEGNGSELSDALRMVDEQMLTGMTDSARGALRPLLVRPLQQAFQVVVRPAESEINRVWTSQVYEPWRNNLAGKYPFTGNAKIEASAVEIAKVFGPDGAIAKFVDQTLGALVVRRGDSITPRTWGDTGVRLAPEFSSRYGAWVAPLAAGGGGGTAGGGAGPAPQYAFQILPQPAPGLTEYTVDIDGQELRYRNAQAEWVSLVFPGPKGPPGGRVSGVTFDGRGIEFANFPGNFGFQKLIESSQNKKRPDGTVELTWTNANLAVTVQLRILSRPGPSDAPTAGAAAQPAGYAGAALPATVAGGPEAAAPPAASAPAATSAPAAGSVPVKGASK